jgi:hypothetical protein
MSLGVARELSRMAFYMHAGIAICMYREDLHVYAAAGGTRARMGMHVPTADVT